ncbi:MAG: translation initiation factor IF-2 N-terminal domain-containing protein [Planctomycetes bacterium]|nr:translation initiation factor IF-2 N-terminal domain-containing protein [Planctomycetota bacterium]
MAKRGVKLKDLARELGVTSRTLLDRCRAAGLPAQNSISKLSEAQAAAVRGWFGAEGGVAHGAHDQKT